MNPMLSTILEGAMPAFIALAAILIVLPWLERESPWRLVPVLASIALTLKYLYWRATETIPPFGDSVDFVAGSLFFAIELAACTGAVLSLATLARVRSRSADVDRNRPWLSGLEELPVVDVFICTYNEEREILERTIVGATSMTYPRYRVWVLDDGRRPWVAELAAELNCNYLNRPDNAHAKAGNINHALGYVRGLETPPDFVSILDADFVPAPMFLDRTMTLFRDETVGIVQTPQHFINPDPIQTNLQTTDAWPDEQRYFFDVLMPSKDAWGTAFCCGTSSVIRMSALDASGDFPTESVTEDYLLTLRLRRLGYQTVYLNERLSMGLAPEGLREYITQRSRWCLGFFQIVRGPDGPFARRNGLRLIDRLSLAESMLYWLGSYAMRVAALVVPVLYLLFGVHAVNVSTTDGIANFLPYYLTQIVVMAWISGQRILPVLTDVSQLLAAREILSAATTGLLHPKGQKFKVTAKGGDRSRTVVQWRMLATFGVFLSLTIAAVVYAFWGNKTLQDSSAVALYWSWYNILILICAMAVCIERPRLRRHERLKGARTVTLRIGQEVHLYETADISVGGLRLLGSVPAAAGTPVLVDMDSVSFQGTIVRRSASDFAIRIEDSVGARAAMVRHVYSGQFKSPVQSIGATRVARRLAARLSS